MSTGNNQTDSEMKALGEVSQNSGSYGASASAIEYRRELPRYVRVTDIGDDGHLKPGTKRSINWDEAKGYLLGKDDLIFARSGSVGKSYLYRPDDGICAHAGYTIRYELNAEQVEPRYVFHWTQSEFFWRWIGRMKRVGAQPNINASEYASHELPVPPLQRQKHIADVLDTVDRAIRKTKKLVSKLEKMKLGLRAGLLTRGINENGRIRDTDATRDGFRDSKIGTIPSSWRVEKLDQIAERITSGPRGWAKYYADDGHPFLRVGNISDSLLEPEMSEVKLVNPPGSPHDHRTRLRTGDILISITADLGRVAVIPPEFPTAFINQHLALVRPRREDEIAPRWVGLFLRSWLCQKQIRALDDMGAKSGLNLSAVGQIRIALPTISEQRRIFEALTPVNDRIVRAKSVLRKLQNVKKGLSADLFESRIV